MSMHVRKGLLFFLLLTFGAAGQALAQTGSIAGRITAAGTDEPLPSAQVEAVGANGTVAARTVTNQDGRFRLTPLREETYTVNVRLYGWAPQTRPGVAVTAGAPAEVSFSMTPQAVLLDPTVVSATRGQEAQKLTEAPASISTVEPQVIEERPALTTTDYVKELPGVDAVQTGLVQSNVVTRGFNNVFSGAVLTLTDYRYAFVPSLRLNAPWLSPTANEDIERIEVLLGPASALYGPNSATGVMHVITKSPFNSQGVTLSVAGGARTRNDFANSGDVWQASGRAAAVIGNNFGVKISGQYMTGEDWRNDDAVEQAARAGAIGADPDTKIGLRDFDVERWTGEARADYRPSQDVDVVASVGRAHAGSALEATGIGAAQAKDWKFDYYQARFRWRRLFLQGFMNTSDAGDTYLLRTGAQIVDESRMYAGQIQHGWDFGTRQSFTYGVDLQKTDPRTRGTINGRNEDRDEITEVGGYLHSETRITPKIDFYASARVDDHSRLKDPVFSPRAAIVFKPTGEHNVRLTYGKAFSTPSTNNLSLDLVAGSLFPLPIDIRAVGVPEGGLTFRRDCTGGVGGLCMRSPFNPGGATAALPANAALLWAAAANILFQQSAGTVDIRAIPAPALGQVGTVLRVLNTTTGTFNTVTADQVTDVPEIRESGTETFEVGYKGLIGGRLRLAADVYFERKDNFVGPLIVETPNVFLELNSTAAYLISRGLPQAQATQIAAAMAGISGSTTVRGIPLGTVSPESDLTGTPDLILTYRNFGEIERWGSDLAFEGILNDLFSLTGTYSWTDKDLWSAAELGGLSDIALNAPRNKASIGLNFNHPRSGVSSNIRGRYVQGFPMNSGVYIGEIRDYAVVDLGFAYRFTQYPGLIFSANVNNLLNRQHREFVGAPVLGRFALARFTYNFF
jgi:outer membrane receptor for ferrienterochelin and colicins